ncbi:adenosylcobinamide-GDP ribazoletransferase [Effusibacillus dendaii]|uniref:Adenosylcobinamide-GDP ribazoletransferase n=1 Tax=Effusibacillus dendaii TaxID=2743772 RepID=A0A7I8DDM9_9BACL|nr:adenosylcobinamide-GDP ribazoletransferase [Effusibacillus dendaii]BCJ86630.1 adenosylcobinamide-GDP ribazoletransferase [Effusibacillus dendaii]
MQKIWLEWETAVQFLTRIPWPTPHLSLQKFDADRFVRSVKWYPYVGILIGGILYVFACGLYRWFPAPVASILVLLAEIAITGGLHLDGLMDTADGMMSGRDRERKLEIMKDSRVGAMGVIAFVSLFALKWSLLSEVSVKFPLLLLIMPSIGRLTMVWAIAKYPPARREGMGVSIAGRLSSTQLLAANLALILPLAVWQLHGVLIVLVCAAVMWAFASWIYRSIGGLTGDSYGFLCETAEVVFLLASVGIMAI